MAYNYKLQVPTKPKEERLTRYMFDAHVEQPEKPCEEKPWQGLVAQVDRMLLPVTGECKNPAHTPESCNCGCREKSHTPKTCNCGRDTYKVPIKYNSRYALQSDVSQIKSSKRVKRDVSVENKLKAKLREIKFPSLKPLTKTPAKDLNPTEVEGPLKLKLNLKRSKTATIDDNLRLKRKNESPCAYTYESCDPKKHNKNGCPLCYRCNCEPVTQQRPDQRFSPYDIKIPYKFVTHAEAPGKAPMNQEFDYEPPSYTGLKEQDMYKNYIQQVISKYPEHMARKMPDIQQQQQDLMKFIAELARSDKSPAGKVENEDVRYKIVDNAMDMYKHYEQAISALPKPQFGSNGKLFHKRGAALELVELDPETFNSGSFKIYDNVGSTSWSDFLMNFWYFCSFTLELRVKMLNSTNH